MSQAMVEAVEDAAPGVKSIVFPAFTIGVAMERVLLSAFVDVIVHVETPEPFVTLHEL